MKLSRISNDIIQQMLLVIAIILVGLAIVLNLTYFIPGTLGAVTLYILVRNWYFVLTEKRGWKPIWATSFFLVAIVAVIALPLWLLVEIMIPQVNSLLDNKALIVEKYNALRDFMQRTPALNRISIKQEQVFGYLQKLSALIPMLLNSVAEVFVNIATALFMLYFMLKNARNMERFLNVFLPFSAKSKNKLWQETNMMVRANAIGIPILGFFQGVVAVVGYFIFGVNNALLWGMLTGVATIVPAVGTMIVWVPIAIIQFATAGVTNGVGLTLYCLIIVGGIDNVLRFTILKKIGDVHPLITVFGVILGLKVFGVIGLIFGPLLLSYFGVLVKIYRIEFGKKSENLLNQPPTIARFYP
ncbi:MAG: AI-2E family transporter [Edaphocola sp.]